MTEFGVFSDEGLIVGDFYSREEADAWASANLEPEDAVHVAEVCPGHRESEQQNCEACMTEDDCTCPHNGHHEGYECFCRHQEGCPEANHAR